MDGRTFYFAYGSNMAIERLWVRVPSAKLISVATLVAHELKFHKPSKKDGSGKCDAAYTGNYEDRVLGALYSIQTNQLSELDRFEGRGYGYDRKTVSVSSLADNSAPASAAIETAPIATAAEDEIIVAVKTDIDRGAAAETLPVIEIEFPADGDGEWNAVSATSTIDVEVGESLVHFDAFRSDAVEPAADRPVLDGFDLGESPAAATASDDPREPDEICFGSCCLSSGLYEIFMAEAHQRLAVLEEEAGRLTELAGSTISEPARRAVHTLAGIAGTAGVTVLAELSHALEQYWNRFVQAPLPPAHLPLVQDAVSRLHEMIATIESGQQPETAHDLIAALGELEDERATSAEAAIEFEVQTTEISGSGASIEPAVEVFSAGQVPAAAAASGLPDMDALIKDFGPAAPAPVFDRREVADEIDPQLLPIFLEEAEALVPDTSAQLRAWKATPSGLAARAALRRNLHTIKGSARMVGAMRLGELTHVMEARVIAVIEGQLSASAEVFDTLEAQFDRMADAVDRLKRGELESVVEDAPVPLEAPVEPVLHDRAESMPEAAAATLADSLAPAQPVTRESNALTLRVRADWVDRMVNQAGEVAIARSRIESEVFAFKRHVNELTEALTRLRGHIREG